MIQARALQSQADAHRGDLVAAAPTRRSSRGTPRARVRHQAAGTAARAQRPAVTSRVGSWLIAFGTKLGGTSVRTS